MLNKFNPVKKNDEDLPRLYVLLKSDNLKTKREINLEKDQKQF